LFHPPTRHGYLATSQDNLEAEGSCNHKGHTMFMAELLLLLLLL
jgi:hypothetical protein